MIKIVNDDFLHTKAQICVQIVNDEGDLKNNIPDWINNEYHHITKEYIKYINYYQKHRLETFNTTMYVPVDCWAVGLVDTIKNNYLDKYDKDFKYIACAFCRKREGKKYKIDFRALKECLKDICRKAQSVHANVAITYSGVVEQAVREVFEESTVDVYLVKE